MNCIGPGSSVGIAARYGLDGPGIKSRWGARFSAPVQTGPWDHPASCTMGTGSFVGVKSSWGVMLTPHLLLVPWSWKGRAIPLLPLWAVQSLSVCTWVHFTLLLYMKCIIYTNMHSCEFPIPCTRYHYTLVSTVITNFTSDPKALAGDGWQKYLQLSEP